jgi:signal transduction histidine kinase
MTVRAEKPQLSLVNRGLLLVFLSMSIQIVLIASIYFQTVNDKYAVESGKSRDMSIEIRGVIQCDIATILAANQSVRNRQIIPQVEIKLAQLREWNKLLISHLPSDKLHCTEPLIHKTEDLVSILTEVFTASADLGTDQSKHDHRTIEKLLVRLENTERELEQLQLDLVEQLTQKRSDGSKFLYLVFPVIAVTGSCLNIIVLFVMTSFLSNAISKRVANLNESCLRFTRGQRVENRVPTSSDEIDKLEQAVQQMFNSVTETAHKQQTLFENVHDVLCVIDDKTFCFTAVNKMGADILGLTTKYLIDLPIAALFCDPEKNALDNFKVIVEQRAQPPFHMCVVNAAPFEIELKKGDDSHALTLWSVKYVPAAGSLYCVVHDITERKAAEDIRKEIVQMVNHDLRSPLAAINIIYAILEDYGNLSEKGIANLAVASANTVRMRRLIDDLLDIGKLDAGMLKLDLANTKLSRVIQQSIESVQTLAKVKGISLVDTSSSDISLYADSHRLEQILINLLSNAIKFSPKGQSVLVSAIETAEYVEVSVTDFGRGVPADMTTTIFDRFTQVYESDASRKGGSGLGLAICKALVQLHRGQIGVESGPGSGSRFYFRLPCDADRSHLN